MTAYSTRAENIMEIVENAGHSFRIVFKGLLPHLRENLELCGKGSIILQDVK